MLTKRGVTARAANYAALGSENNDRQFEYIRLLSLSNQLLSRTKQTPFLYIEAPDITSPPQFLRAYLKNGGLVKLPYLINFGTHRSAYKTTEADTRSASADCSSGFCSHKRPPNRGGRKTKPHQDKETSQTDTNADTVTP